MQQCAVDTLSGDGEAPLSVTQAMSAVKRNLESLSFHVMGEVSELSNKPGYKAVYFTLHDDGAAMPCLMWRNVYDRCDVELRAGLLVEVSGFFTAYVPKGRMNFSVRSMKLAGEGDLRTRVAALAKKLQREGLMEPSRKRNLPSLPTRIAVVTSPRGKAVHDCLRTLRRRFPLAEVLVCGVAVEGASAPQELCHGLQVAQDSGADVILLVRGGGSYEDLMPFNDEGLARAVAASRVPVVSGIGHEPDNSIVDMVSDRRCSTPTAAAEAVAPSVVELAETIDAQGVRLTGALSHTMDVNRLALSRLSQRSLFSNPEALLADRWIRIDVDADKLAHAIPDALVADGVKLDYLKQRLVRSHEANFTRFDRAIALIASRLNDLSPLNVLSRGYSLTYDSVKGHVVASVDDVAIGDEVLVKLSDGEIGCEVNSQARRKENVEQGND